MRDDGYKEFDPNKPSKKKDILFITIGIILEIAALVVALIFTVLYKGKTNSNSIREVIPLHKWQFYKNLTQISQDIDKINFSQIIDHSEEVNVPHTWNNYDGQNGGNNYSKIPCSYQTYFQYNDLANKRIFIEFCGSNLKTTVYVNGQKAGYHVGGYAKFRFEITKYLTSQTNLITVVVDNRNNLEYYPYTADFTFFGGIYRDVNIIAVNKVSFNMSDFGSRALYIKPNATTGEVEFNVSISNDSDQKELHLRYKIYDNSEKVILENETTIQSGKKTQSIKTTITAPHLWNGRDDPYLYHLTVDLMVNGEIYDRVESNFGFRTVKVNYSGFYLNGVKYQLRGVSRHQDRLDKGWAVSNDEEEEDFNLIYELGANAVRLSHYQQNETVYDYCDKKGLIIICEVSFISQFLNTTKSEENLKDQLSEMVKQNYNHPCVAFWGYMNEIVQHGDSPQVHDTVKRLQKFTNELDSTRGTYGAMLAEQEHDNELNTIPDVIGYNLYGGWYVGTIETNAEEIDDIRSYPQNKPLSLTEYGAEGILKYHSDNPVNHDYSEEYQLLFHEKFYDIIVKKDLWGSFVWNMFDFASDSRDEGGMTGRNNKGLVTYDRKTKKESFFFYKSNWNKQQKFVHVCGVRFHDRATPYINVTVLTSLTALNTNLYIYNNESLIDSISNNVKNINVFNVTLNKGINLVTAVIKDPDTSQEISSHTVEFEKVDEPNPDYVLH